jgi:hypothetical protein
MALFASPVLGPSCRDIRIPKLYGQWPSRGEGASGEINKNLASLTRNSPLFGDQCKNALRLANPVRDRQISDLTVRGDSAPLGYAPCLHPLGIRTVEDGCFENCV